MSNIKLPTYVSHSAAQAWKECQEKHYLRYIERVKPIEMGSSLGFGIAIDTSIAFLLTNVQNGTREEGLKGYKDVFLNHAEKGWNLAVNDLNMRYRQKDYDSVVIRSSEDKLFVSSWERELEVKAEDAIKAEKQKEHKPLKENEFLMFNKLCWISLKNKGLLMLEAFVRDVLPKIKKVIAIQHKIEGKTAEGVDVVGYIDLIAELEGYDKPIIIDLKTSASYYDADSIFLAEQLTLYTAAVGDEVGTDLAGYIVLLKQMDGKALCSKCGYLKDSTHRTCNNDVNGVRCKGEWDEIPEAKVQILVDRISKDRQNDFMNGFSTLASVMNQGLRIKNLNACKNYGLCDYYHLCHFGDKSKYIFKNEENK